jgi:hypothetical protein
MRFQFSLRTMFLAVFVVAALLAFFTPVARINSATCARITPGMTVEQACEIVGAPPGLYDGVVGFSSDAPDRMGYIYLSWVGLRGEILVDLDDSGRVSQATFYSIRRIDWLPLPPILVWERWTRVKYLGLPVTTRTILFFVLTATTTFVVGLYVVQRAAPNATARHGVIGLVLGPIFAVAMFSEEFVSNLPVTALAMCGPILGAFIGIFVGLVSNWVSRWTERRFGKMEVTGPATVNS